jgi:hypothetical protein
MRNRVAQREAFDGDGDVVKYVQNLALYGIEVVNRDLKAVLGACVYHNFDLTAAVNEGTKG